jgi:hypothetical protein
MGVGGKWVAACCGLLIVHAKGLQVERGGFVCYQAPCLMLAAAVLPAGRLWAPTRCTPST